MSDEFARPNSFKAGLTWLLNPFAISLVAVVVAAYAYVSGERQHNRDLASASQSLAASNTQVENQLRAMSPRLSELAAQTTPGPASIHTQRQTRARRAGELNVVHDNVRLGVIESQLNKQEKQIAGTREDIDRTKNDLTQTRDDLLNNLNSSKTELNGAIAFTHQEVVALQKRGERNYYEFALDKSKQSSRVGPVRIALRKADTKHKRFDMTMLVDDNELEKKSVNLYEPVWISLSDRAQPVELVVNKIAKDHIEGYLSEPKYKKSDPSHAVATNPPSQP
jgi:hypothetical protein